MTDQWRELKETIMALSTSEGTATQQEVCTFLMNLMDLLEKQMPVPKTGHCEHSGEWYRQTNDYVDYYECSNCGMAVGIYDVKNYCPNCGSRNEVEE